MFENFRKALDDLLGGRVAPEERRSLLGAMKQTLAQARVALDDLREGVAATRRRLVRERTELETVRRRKGLAEGIGDQETVRIAEKFEAQHAERVAVLERKLEAQEHELALTQREVEEMTQQLKAAVAGVGSGMAPGSVPGPTDAAGLNDTKAELERELEGLNRSERRAAAEAEADARLAELKRRMGK